MIKEQRRQYPRKTLNPLPHIHLPSGNGGIVLDVSEQGLRFRSIAPLEQSGPIVFSFSSHSSLIAGMGELVWLDHAKKTGGLRFTELPYSALEQIRKWPHDANLRMDVSEGLTLHSPAPDQSRSWWRNERSARAAAKVASAFHKLLPEPFRSKVRESWLPALRNAFAELRALVPESYFQKVDRRLFKAGFALSLGIVVLTTVSVRHRQAGELLVRLGTKLSGGVNTLTPRPAIASVSPRVDEGTAYRSNVDGPVAPAVPPSVSAAAGNNAKELPAGTVAPQPPETSARPSKLADPGAKLVVQVAAVKDEADARKLTDTLRQENFAAFVGTLPVDSLYRVMLGPYADQASARVVLGKLKRAGFNSFIRRESGAERLGS
jgi:cell division septation protein DedD